MPEQAVAPTVDSAKLEECSSKQRESKDKYERSLTWITYATGRKVGCLSFTKNKVRYRLKIASTDEFSVKEIREQARKLKAEFVLDPVGFNQTYLSSLSVEQFIHDKYLPSVRATHRSHKTIESRVKPIVAALGRKPLNRVTRFDIEDFLTESNKTCSVATRNRYLAQVKAIMSFAVERGILKSSPAAGIPAKHEAVLPPKGLPDEVVNKVVHRLMK
ncbi:TPA: hypothetical protein ACRTMT_004446, partial [Aeromonas hydrophila]